MATDMECSLFRVCKAGDLDGFRRLYNEDNSILNQKTNGLQETPLHLATRYNHNNLVTEILNHGNHTAKAKNGEQDTPLHVACRLGFLDIVTMLLNACSFLPYMRNRDRQCALFLACFYERSEVALILCDSMDFDFWDCIGASCLWIAASKGYEGVVQKILNKNLSLASRKDENGFSALHWAAREGKIGVIKGLLGKDKNLSLLRENNGRTPLQLAAVSRKDAAVEEFLSAGSTLRDDPEFRFTDLINIADNDGNTILHHAATGNFLEIVKTLAEDQGMNVKAVNNQGRTALAILEQPPVSTEKNDIIQKLKDRNGDNPLSVTPVQQTLMVVAALILTITFQTGLTPPGGFWPDSNGTNQTHHKAGKAIQNTTNPKLLTAFTVADAMAFTMALAMIPTILILPKLKAIYVHILAVVALILVEITFILGLVIVCDGFIYFFVELISLLVAAGPFIWMYWRAWRG